MKLMPSSSTIFRIVSACPSVTGRPPQIRESRISMAPKLKRVTFRPVRPKTEVGNASDTFASFIWIRIVYPYYMQYLDLTLRRERDGRADPARREPKHFLSSLAIIPALD